MTRNTLTDLGRRFAWALTSTAASPARSAREKGVPVAREVQASGLLQAS
jgi:hypothetical protein